VQEASLAERRGAADTVRWREALQVDHSLAADLLASSTSSHAVLLFEVLQHPTSLQSKRGTRSGHIPKDVMRIAWAFLFCANPGVRAALATAVHNGTTAEFKLQLYR
jgi:hypothetical protein